MFHAADDQPTGARGDAVLLTGASGFLGGEVLIRLLRRDHRNVVVLMRAKDDRAARARVRAQLETILGADAGRLARRVIAVPADVTAPDLGIPARRRQAIAEQVETVIHSAASVSFSLPLAEAHAINLTGTARVMDLAAQAQAAGGLRRYVHVSTAYVAGDHKGRFGEEHLDVGQGFNNTYERSKWDAEHLVRSRAAELPISIVRPSIVVGDSRTGYTPAFNVIYWPLRAYSRGLLQVIPALADAVVDVVPVDYVADAILALSDDPGDSLRTHHLVAGRDATSIGELAASAGSYFDRPPPRLMEPDTFVRDVVEPVRRSGSPRAQAMLEQASMYFPYFNVAARFENTATISRLSRHGFSAPPLSSYFGRLLDFAERAAWGKRMPTRAAVALSAA